jgi:hypothetical protein
MNKAKSTNGKHEALRYLKNAREVIRQSPIEAGIYTDMKYVREACGTAYLAILIAIDEFLLEKGLTKKELPKSVEAYRDALNKKVTMHNGKTARQFESLYDSLHIAGYYRGLLSDVNVLKDIFKSAKNFILKFQN